MTIPNDFPKLQPLVNATITALSNLGGSASNQEILDEVIKVTALSDRLVEVPHKNGGLTFLEYRLHWARTYLRKAGLVENTNRGVWALTPEGRSISKDRLNNVVKLVRTQDYEARKATQGKSIEEAEEGVDDLNWQEELLGILLKITPAAFERVCQRLLRESGFVKVEVTGRSGDGGIDGQGVLRVNLVSFHVLFQAKRWQSSVGASVVRDFRGAMVGRADKGLIIATSTFTKDARTEATRDGAPAIDLVDGEDLCRLLKETKVGVEVRFVEEVHINRGIFDSI